MQLEAVHRHTHEAHYAHTITDIPSISFEKNGEKRSSVLSINFPSWTRGSWGQVVQGLPQTLRDRQAADGPTRCTCIVAHAVH